MNHIGYFLTGFLSVAYPAIVCFTCIYTQKHVEENNKASKSPANCSIHGYLSPTVFKSGPLGAHLEDHVCAALTMRCSLKPSTILLEDNPTADQCHVNHIFIIVPMCDT